MRVARPYDSSARALLVAAVAMVFLAAPPVVAAEDTRCVPMNTKIQTAYRALENRHYSDAHAAFREAWEHYALCIFAAIAVRDPALAAEVRYWAAYAVAGKASAKFGDGDIANGLKFAQEAADNFGELINGTSNIPAASGSLRTAAIDGLAYVRSLDSAKKPLLPKIWLDWKAAHP